MSRPKYHQVIVLDRLKEVCQDINPIKKGYGYNHFIEEIGICRSTFTNVIYNKKDFSSETLYRIAETTNVSLDWLFGLSDRKYINE